MMLRMNNLKVILQSPNVHCIHAASLGLQAVPPGTALQHQVQEFGDPHKLPAGSGPVLKYVIELYNRCLPAFSSNY